MHGFTLRILLLHSQMISHKMPRDATREEILSPKAIFQQKLQNSYSSDAINILEIIEPAIFNFAQSSLNCVQIDNINLNSFESKRAGIKSICNDVANLLQPITSQSAKNILKTRLTDSLLNRMQGILSNSFIEPTANFLASGAAHKINQQINEHIARMKKQEEAERIATQNNEWQDPDKLVPLDSSSLSEDEKAKIREFKNEVEEIFEKEIQKVDDTITATISEDGQVKIKETKAVKALKVMAQASRKASDAYLEFAKEHPLIANWGLTALNVVVQTVLGGGIPGFINAVRSELTGHAFGALAAPVLQKTIEVTAKELQEKFKGLNERDAKTLAATAIIGGIAITAGASGVKNFLRGFKQFLNNPGTKLAFAGTVNIDKIKTTKTAEKGLKNFFNSIDDTLTKKTYAGSKVKAKDGIKATKLFDSVSVVKYYKKAGWIKNLDGKWHHPAAKDMTDIIPNKPHAIDGKLKSIYDQLYRSSDLIPGGTAEILKAEIRQGASLRHLKKAKSRLAEINKVFKDGHNSLSRLELKTAERVQKILRDAIKMANKI